MCLGATAYKSLIGAELTTVGVSSRRYSDGSESRWREAPYRGQFSPSGSLYFIAGDVPALGTKRYRIVPEPLGDSDCRTTERAGERLFRAICRLACGG